MGFMAVVLLNGGRLPETTRDRRGPALPRHSPASVATGDGGGGGGGTACDHHVSPTPRPEGSAPSRPMIRGSVPDSAPAPAAAETARREVHREGAPNRFPGCRS